MQYKEDPNYLLIDFCRYLSDNHVVVIGMTDEALEEHFKVYLREKDYKQPADLKRFIWLFKFFFMTPDPEKGENAWSTSAASRSSSATWWHTASMTVISRQQLQS